MIGADWLSEFPPSWKELRADFLCNPYRVTVSPERYAGETIAHYSIPQVQETGGPLIEPADDIDSSKLLISRPTLLVSKLNPRKQTICIAQPQGDMITLASGEFVAIQSDQLDQRYAYYVWLSEKVTERLSAIVQSATRSHQRVNPADILKLPWKWPPRETQKRIAAFLDQKTEQIDGMIARKQALLERLAEKREAIITYGVTKGLNPATPMKDSGIAWLEQIPAHWEVRGLTKCTTRIDYRGATPEKSANGVFLVTARNIKGGKIDYSLSEEFIPPEDYEHVMRRGKPALGDVLFTTEAPLGEIATIDRTDIALAQRVIKFRSSMRGLDNLYLALWMQSRPFQFDLQSRATGSTALGLKASKIVELRCLLPPLAEQRLIVDHVCDAIGRVDVAASKISVSCEKLNGYRSALITNAVTGQMERSHDDEI